MPSPTSAPTPTAAPAEARETPRVVVIGLGGAGLRIAARLLAHPQAGWLTVAGVDTDERALAESSLPTAFAIGSEWTQGQGCGGDPQRGARALAHKTQKQLEQFLHGAALVFVVGGMGGGVATGGAPVLGRLARRLRVPAIFLATLPFSFEGHARRETAEEGLRHLIPDAEVVIPVPNDLLFANLAADTAADAAFRAADEALSGAILTLAEILRCRSLLAADFADLRTVIGNRKTFCAIGFGESDGCSDGDPAQHLLESLAASPLLGGTARIAEADALVAVLSGGPGFTIGEMKQALEAIQRHCRPGCRIVAGAVTAPELADRRRLTVLAIQFDPEAPPLPDHEFRTAPPRATLFRADAPPSASGKPVQGEFPLFGLNRGIFENTAPNVHDGVDLDIPTFQRQEITIDKGR
jgi:cell division protein FtsZ